MRKSGVLSEVARLARIHNDQMKAIRKHSNPQQLTATAQTAAALRDSNQQISVSVRAMSLAFDKGVLQAAKSLAQQDGIAALAASAAKWHS
jgi:hypothetical protein